MHPLLESVLETRIFKNEKNEEIKVNSFTPRGQCEFLQNLILENGFKRSIEIGLAYGISTLAITEAIARNGGSHTAIDKFEVEWWSGHGLELMKKSGLGEKVEFREQWCYEALPELLKEGRAFDFAYVDTTKQFDWVLMNFFYLDKLLVPNGIIVFDDAGFPGIRKVLRLITQYPNYEVIGQWPVNQRPSLKRRLAKLFTLVPGARRIIRPEILSSDFKKGLNASCVGVRKKEMDQRIWDWHKDF